MLSYRYSTVPINKFRSGIISVVDPNTLNLDPDPEFWPNLDTDPVLYVINFERKIILNKTIFFK